MKKVIKKKLEDTRIEKSSGNIYEDLGFINAEEMLAKAGLVFEIQKAIKRKKMTQVAAAKILGLTQPKLSMLLRGHFSGYSTDRLIRFLRILGNNIEIYILPMKKNQKAHLHVYSSLEKTSSPLAAKSK